MNTTTSFKVDHASESANHTDGCQGGQTISGLELTIRDNPHLTGPQAIELYTASIATENLRMKNQVKEEFEQLKSSTDKYFKGRTVENETIYVKILGYTLTEYSEIYVQYEEISVFDLFDSKSIYKKESSSVLSYFASKNTKRTSISEEQYNVVNEALQMLNKYFF